MRLRRIKLTHYRGVEAREVVFAADGVTVVEGPNEVGKSSMIEALDLLLETKDSSKTKQLRAVAPRGKDVGPSVTAELESGPYRFVYAKQWLRQPTTTLDILAPKREQLTGEAAHERVLAMLSATADMTLWKALRMLQTARGQVEVDGCPAVLKALDAAVGPVTLSGTETTLLARIEGELRRYYTPGGRPTNELRVAKDELQAAREAADHIEAVRARHESDLDRHEALTGHLLEQRKHAAPIRAELDQARAAAAELERRAARITLAKEQAARTKATALAAIRESRERAELLERVREREEAAGRFEAEHVAARAEQDSAQQAAQEAQARQDELLESVQRARDAWAGAQHMQERAKLAADLVAAQSAGATARSAMPTARILLLAVAALVAGVMLGWASGLWPLGAVVAVVLFASGWWFGRPAPAPDPVIAPVQAAAIQEAATDDAVLRARDRHAELETELAAARQQCAEAQARITQAQVRSGVVGERADSARTELAALRQRLDEARAALADGAAQANAVELEEAARAAQTSLDQLGADMASVDEDRVGARLAAAKAAAAEHDQRVAAAERELTAVATRLELGVGAAHQEAFDSARSRLEHAQEEHDRVAERAAAAKLLWETVIARRDAARSRYAEPLERTITELGATVFGASFEVELDGQLRIAARTLDGVTVDFDSLSEGTKEQLGVLVRLACAQLVDLRQGAPMIIDDALGHSDPERLARMRQVLGAAKGQVIVLTCYPGRFADVGQVVRL